MIIIPQWIETGYIILAGISMFLGTMGWLDMLFIKEGKYNFNGDKLKHLIMLIIVLGVGWAIGSSFPQELDKYKSILIVTLMIFGYCFVPIILKENKREIKKKLGGMK